MSIRQAKRALVRIDFLRMFLPDHEITETQVPNRRDAFMSAIVDMLEFLCQVLRKGIAQPIHFYRGRESEQRQRSALPADLSNRSRDKKWRFLHHTFAHECAAAPAGEQAIE